jgi:hypothetical protein
VILFNGRVVASDRIDHLTRRTETLIVDVTDHVDELAAELARRGAHATVDDYRVTVQDRPGSTVDLHDVVRDALVFSGAGVRAMGAQRVSLEDVFLEVGTGADTRDLQAGTPPLEDVSG